MSSANPHSGRQSGNKKKLDKEWIQLMAEAKKIGIKPEDIRQFIAYQKKNR
ncbi:MAG: DNA-binding anti-repressor SinI [Bacillaceae bacterium]|nr:DNA-binding anti-repressor SinI [Bacillaceae bacterium]